MIDLRSDTVTKPTSAMLKVMLQAEVGDDAYQEDRNVLTLQEYCADLFGKEKALFMPSGTMSNQIALRVHTKPGDEVILESTYHINFYESAQTSDLAKVALNPCSKDDGVLTVADIENLINSKYRAPIYAAPRLICVENTIGGHAGKAYPFEVLSTIYDYAEDNGLAVHQDGARVLNASIASGISTNMYGSVCDTLSLCFSKGLGAPFGSILLGTEEMIEKAQMYRKWYGGTMHQSGHLAAAALYAIQNHVERLAIDHENAKLFAHLCSEIEGISIDLANTETNMVFMDISELDVTVPEFVELCKREGVWLFPMNTNIVRAVTHLDVQRSDIFKSSEIIKRVCLSLSKGTITA